MTITDAPPEAQFGPWNPGLESQVPARLRHLCTIFRRENVFTSVAEATELRDLTGLAFTDLVQFRPERLALHELLIRVTADLSVPDGSRIEDLGINFRRMTTTLFARSVAPRMDEVRAAYEALRRDLTRVIDAELSTVFAPAQTSEASPPSAPGWLARLGFARQRAVAGDDEGDPERRLPARWRARADTAQQELEKAAYLALARIVSALLVRHGQIWGSRDLVGTLATHLACNAFGSDAIGRLIEPWVATAAKDEGYLLLPRQEEPVVMNTKGPSASGKSTLRPLQRALAGEIGTRWSEFALISPDIWRKQLLDYGTLGAEYKYGGSFTGEELQIIDQKLDRYMARKASRGTMPHLLIDRFRFDSFAPDSDEPGSNLLTRFGRIVYLFFLITPPASLVERAWKRGLDVGRYKAVDDTLAHAIEAYSGMPGLFFTWIGRTDKRVHFEFLDNSVSFGERPRTVAFGWNDEINILDVKCMLDVERYRRVDIDAAAPELLYRDHASLAPERNTGFLRQCVERFPALNFAEQSTGRVYLRLEAGRALWADPEPLGRVLSDPDTRAGLGASVPGALERGLARPDRPRVLARPGDSRPIQTLGRWGTQGRA
ncbi:MAG TPA: hypothetical protein VF420_11180 [Casimicrobiaceae bacterium]